jgi:2-oxoglutarate ferredoxin oxidoreductase subunit alpha
MSEGQMIEDVRLSVHDRIPVYHYGRSGGVVHTPEDILGGFERIFFPKKPIK